MANQKLRIAVVGAGPAGFFAIADLLKKSELVERVDLFDRLPTPYGLVRNGVAPDHQSIKSIAGKYAKDAEGGGARFRLFGNVEIGRDLSVEELRARYHAVIFSHGAQDNRRMGVPGEELSGVHPASIFVAWYNGQPDCAEASYQLDTERAVVVGTGNVAVDVARILLKPAEDLAKTDISDRALADLRRDRIREVVMLGRQSQAHAAYTPAELEELTEIPGVDLVISPEDRRLDPVSEEALAKGTLEPRVRKNLAIVAAKAKTEPTPGNKVIRLRFFSSPVAVLGTEKVEGFRIGENELQLGPNGKSRPVPTGRTEEISCGLVFRSIGYKVAPLAGLPYDDKTASVPHDKGQVLEAPGGRKVPGVFVAGWAKRGPTGVIGTNKPDASETVATLLQEHAAGALPAPSAGQDPADVAALLESRQVQFVGYSDWKLLDQLEVESGKQEGRPRRKFTDLPSMFKAIGDNKLGSLPHDRLIGSGQVGAVGAGRR